MGRVHRPQLPRQQDQAIALPVNEYSGAKTPHSLEYKLPLSHQAATCSTRKLLISTLFWFVVLACGLLSSRPEAALQSRSKLDCVKFGGVAKDVAIAHTSYQLGCETVLAELNSLTAYNGNATSQAHPFTLQAAASECPQATFLHPELALLVDLCPLLQDEHDPQAADSVGYADICDRSQYALPCHTKLVNCSSLARFTVACNKHHGCRSWWLQQQSQHGVCGCAPLMNLVYRKQHAAQAEQKLGFEPLALPSVSVCVWMLIPLGRLSAPCQSCRMFAQPQQTLGTVLTQRQSMPLMLIQGF